MTADTQEELLLLRMLPEQVSERWEFFAPTLEKSLPPTVVNRRLRMANVLRAILLDELVVWVGQKKDGQIMFVAATQIRVDAITLTKDLLIYAFTGFGELRPVYLLDAFDKIGKYAKSQGCESLLAYVDEERVKNWLVSQGARADFTLIQMEV